MPDTKLKPIHEQVVVITGATSGIGRETALQFAEAGATIVPIARSRESLDELEKEIERIGGRAHAIVADVSDWNAVRAAADEAAERFGRIDTWVNNAAVSMYATVEESSVDEIRRLVDVILMGQIHGVKAALPHLTRQGRGAIINVASILAKRSVPLQAAYCAAKHGIKGFTESLRLELERDHPGIHATLILPSSMNTPLFEHARSKLDEMPQPIPPVYEAEVTARSIVFAAQHPRREIIVGGAGKMLTVLERLSPRLADRYMLMQDRGVEQQKSGRSDPGHDNLEDPMTGTGRVAGEFGADSKSRSMYTRVFEHHPARKRWAVAGAVAGGGGPAPAAGGVVGRPRALTERPRGSPCRAGGPAHAATGRGSRGRRPSTTGRGGPHRGQARRSRTRTLRRRIADASARDGGADMMDRRPWLADAFLGAAAGVAATWIMGKATQTLYERESEEAREREQEARDGKTAYGVAAEKSARLLGEELSDEERQQYGNAIHWALGAGAGAVYGVMRPRVSWISSGFGALYGVLFWLTIDEGGNTLLGLTPPPQEFPWETHARGLAGHVVFGLAAESVLRTTDAL